MVKRGKQVKPDENNKHRNERSTVVVIFLQVFGFVVGFNEFLHSHPADTCDHVDCAVFVFLAVARASALGAAFLFFIIMAFFMARLRLVLGVVERFVYYVHGIRGPPFDSGLI